MVLKNQPTKQVIIVNNEITMSPGKLAVQVAHASTKAITDLLNGAFIHTPDDDHSYQMSLLTRYGGSFTSWLHDNHTKIVLQASYNEMTNIYNLAMEIKIPCSFIIDNGRTELPPLTPTCAAIGPYWSDKIDELTGHLKLL
jgi:PTH2 family peptidyl-tRNA hydrolase